MLSNDAMVEFQFSLDQNAISVFKSFTIQASGFLCGFLNAVEVHPSEVTLKTKAAPKRKLQTARTGNNEKLTRIMTLPTTAPVLKAPETQPTKPRIVSNVDLNCFKEWTSEGQKLYLCNLCSYRSNDRGNIKKHINLKHNENCPKFQCSMCSFQSKVRGNLKGHYINVHGLPETVAKSATTDSVLVWHE